MTSKKAIKKRKYQPRPGIKQAAELLGVSYGHLRMCFIGVRQSKSLMARYHALLSREGADPEPLSKP